MAVANLPVEPSQYVEILDEEFNQYLEVAKTLMLALKKPADKDICGKYIKKCTALDAPSIEVKTNRNEFFKYFLKLLQTAATTQPPHYDNWFRPKVEKHKNEEMSSYWSSDKKTYVAAKTIRGFGTLVYIAASHKPEYGWQENGFKSYEF